MSLKSIRQDASILAGQVKDAIGDGVWLIAAAILCGAAAVAIAVLITRQGPAS